MKRAYSVAVVCVALLCLYSLPAVGAERLSAGPVTVLFASGRARTAHWLLEAAPRISSRIAGRYGGSAAMPFVVVLVDKPVGGDPAMPEELPEWAAGAAVQGQPLIFLKAASAMRGGASDLERTLTHELVHLHLHRLTAGRLPRWFEEGVAMRESGELSLTQRLGLAAWMIGGRLPSFSELERDFPAGRLEATAAYGASASFVAWLAGRGGKETLAPLVWRVAARVSFDDAFFITYGLSVPQAAAEWSKRMRSGSGRFYGLASDSLLWGLLALLLCLAWLVRKQRDRRILRRMAEEESEGQDAADFPDENESEPFDRMLH